LFEALVGSVFIIRQLSTGKQRIRLALHFSFFVSAFFQFFRSEKSCEDGMIYQAGERKRQDEEKSLKLIFVTAHLKNFSINSFLRFFSLLFFCLSLHFLREVSNCLECVQSCLNYTTRHN